MPVANLNHAINDPADLDLRVYARTVYLSLLAVVAVLALASCFAKLVMITFPEEQYGAVNELCKRVYLDFENNIPAWFSTLGLFASASLFGLIAMMESQRKNRDVRYWLGLSVLFVALAIDEATYIHEILIVSLRNKLNLSGIFFFSWVIPGALFVLTVGLTYLPFVMRLPRTTRNGLMIAACCYVGGALGVEMIGGMLAESNGMDSMSYVLAMTTEESLELVGIMTLIYVLLRHVRTLCPESLRITFR